MTILIILAVLSLAGIGAAFWLLKGDQESENGTLSEALDLADSSSSSPEEKAPEPASSKEPKSSLLEKLKNLRKTDPSSEEELPVDVPSGPKSKSKISLPKISLPQIPMDRITDILKKLQFWKKDEEPIDIPEVTPLSSLKESIEQAERNALADLPETGTASITTVSADAPPQEQPVLENEEKERAAEPEAGLSNQLKELEEKYQKLDALFKEKSSELEKTKESLSNEVENRKEFNKVKDLLEKEIKDSKDRTRNVQVEGENVKGEVENHKRRAAQLEEKITRLEKELIEKDEKINDLVKRLQTFASPSTASAPPVREETIEEPRTVLPLKKEEPAPEPAVSDQPAPTADETQPPKEPIEEKKDSPENTAQTDVSFEAEPPEPREEPSEDEPQEESFLKLKPDVISQESPESGSIANEIERSLETPQEPEIKLDPGKSSKPDNEQ